MRYAIAPIRSGTVRTFRRFAWYPRRLGWVWVWLEKYIVSQAYIDPDGDGVYQWTTVAEEPICPKI